MIENDSGVCELACAPLNVHKLSGKRFTFSSQRIKFALMDLIIKHVSIPQAATGVTSTVNKASTISLWSGNHMHTNI